MTAYKTKLPGPVLTVVIRDDGPLVHANDSPRYRSVRVQLTGEQRKMLKLHPVGTSNGIQMYEEVSQCFIENEDYK